MFQADLLARYNFCYNSNWQNYANLDGYLELCICLTSKLVKLTIYKFIKGTYNLHRVNTQISNSMKYLTLTQKI